MQERLLFLTPYVVSVLLTTVIGVHAIGRPHTRAARPFAFMVFSQSAWTLGFIVELYSPEIAQKIFWDNIQFVTSIGWTVGFVSFAVSYAGRRLRTPVVIYLIVALVPSLISAAAFADLWSLVRIDPVLVKGQPFDALYYRYGPLVYVWAGYGFVLQVLCALMILKAWGGELKAFRPQGIAVVIANFLPFAAMAFASLGIVNLLHRDVSAYAFAVGALIIAIALLRYQLFDIVPIARDAVIEQIENPIIVLDLEDRIVDMNPSARTLLLGAEIGQRIQDAAVDWPEVVVQLDGRDEFRTEVVGDVEGDMRYFDLNLLPLSDKKGRRIGHLIHAHEISDRKYTEYALHARTKELEDLLDRLEAAQRELIDGERFAALGKLTSVVSHELRNPLGTVRNALYSIRDSVEKAGSERIERAISLAERNVVRCDLIIEELLNYTRKTPAEVEETDLDSWMSGFLSDYDCPGSVTIEFHPGFKSRIPLEREKFRRALINLISNGCQAIESKAGKGGEKAGKIDVSTHRRGGSAVISIADNGEGISAAALGRIFEPLFSTRKIGVGLGLAIVKQTVEEHGGTIEVESSEGNGTTVSVIVPEHRGVN